MEEKKETNFDLIVLGAGPGGYPAAIRAAQLGLKVAIVEAKEMGGTCLNRGCIPSKALIASAEAYHKVKEADSLGISCEKLSFDYSKMSKRKDDIVDKMRKNLESLVAANQVTIFKGFGKFASPKEIRIAGRDNALIKADKIIIATGSEPRSMPAFPFDFKKIHDSTSFLNLKTLPKRLVIVGGGVIGCEFASLHNLLGVDVTIIELLPRILPMESENVSEALTKSFTKKGIKIKTNSTVQKIDTESEEGITVHLSDGSTVEGDIALVSVGRVLNTDKIDLVKAGIAPLPNGMIQVDSKMETSVPGIYAIGDIASKWWLAHVATHQGLVAAGNAAGKEAHMHYNAVPSVTFTEPEIATVGLSLEEAKKQGWQAAAGAFPFAALGRSQASNDTEGFGQLVYDQKTGLILGAQVVGREASVLIAEIALAITNELTLESISETIHAHPTLPEVWLEASYVAEGLPVHILPRKRK